MPRIFLTISLALLLAQGFVDTEVVGDSPTLNVHMLMQQSLSSIGPNILTTTLVFESEPGDPGTEPHYHSGPVVGYVIEGEFLLQIEGKLPRIIHAGEAFFEPDGVIHVWGVNASNSTLCRFTATVFGRPDTPFTTVVTDFKRQSKEEALALARQTLDANAASSAPILIQMV